MKNRMMLTKEWAKEYKVDPCLFAYWKELVSEKEFKQLMKQVGL